MLCLLILKGNLFSCETVDELPENDPSRMTYVCAGGSSNLNVAIYVYASAIVFPVVFGYLLWSWGSLALKSVCETVWLLVMLIWNLIWRGQFHSIQADEHTIPPSLSVAFDILFSWRQYCLRTAGAVLVLLLPLYTLLKFVNGREYSTFFFQYAFIVSVAFMQGEIASVIFASCWFVLLILFALAIPRTGIIIQPSTSYLLIPSVVANIVVMTGVNSIYVYAHTTQTPQMSFMFSTVVAVFKLIWNGVLFRYLDAAGGTYSLIVATSAFNIVISPIIATMVISTECFQGVFITNPEVCEEYSVLDTTVCWTASYSYVHRCSSALLLSFVQVFVIMFLMSGLCVPAAQLLLHTRYRLLAGGSVDKDNSAITPEARESRFKELQFIWKYSRSLNVFKCSLIFPLHVRSAVTGDELDQFANLAFVDETKYFFYPTKHMCVDCSIAAFVMLTYGIAYPVLAIICAIYIVLNTALFQIYVRQHSLEVLEYAMERRKLWAEVVSRDCVGLDSMLFGYIGHSLVFSALFVCSFVFDTNLVATKSAPIIMTVISLSTAAIVFWCRWFRPIPIDNCATDSPVVENVVEMGMLVAVATVNPLH